MKNESRNSLLFSKSTFLIFYLFVQFKTGSGVEFISSENNIYDHVNWGTNASQVRDRDNHNGFAYFGIGSCDKRESSIQELQNAPSTRIVLQVYSKVMRIDCRKDMVASLFSLFTLEYVHLKKDHSVILNMDTLIQKGENYLLQFKDKVFLAFRLVVVSQIYVSMQRFPVAPNSPDGKPASDQIFVITNMILGMLDITAKHFPYLTSQFSKEFLSLCNSLVPPTVDNAYLSFYYSRFSKFQMEAALNDILIVSAVREFVFNINKKDAISLAREDFHEQFKKYYIGQRDAYLNDVLNIYSWIKNKYPIV